jgi:hypothetical protein
MSASSLHMSSSSHARGNSCNSSTTVVGGIIVVGLGGGGGGRGMHKANTDKSTMHQETSSAAVRSGRSPTFSQHAPSGRSPSSSSDEVVATRCRGWNPHPGDVSRGSHHEPSPYQECLSDEKGKGKKGHCCSCVEKTMKGPDKRIDAWYSVTYTIKEVKWQPFMNHTRDHAWQAKNHERSATTSNWCHPH